ncbi:jg481 [Pararge aegeria aegeria]|uniref:Jg481 protein n=1 Tax=Pararge aegeria aegeria TaxID=348720 RepID=A0A8S4QSM4_9NEOP|nr:jg481 [Pararge aegeria aegeria]
MNIVIHHRHRIGDELSAGSLTACKCTLSPFSSIARRCGLLPLRYAISANKNCAQSAAPHAPGARAMDAIPSVKLSYPFPYIRSWFKALRYFGGKDFPNAASELDSAVHLYLEIGSTELDPSSVWPFQCSAFDDYNSASSAKHDHRTMCDLIEVNSQTNSGRFIKTRGWTEGKVQKGSCTIGKRHIVSRGQGTSRMPAGGSESAAPARRRDPHATMATGVYYLWACLMNTPRA